MLVRVLEAASSSPATSTKKREPLLPSASLFFLLVEVAPGLELVLRSKMRVRILRAERVAKRRESIRKQLSVVFP